jgi:hypothetical protein
MTCEKRFSPKDFVSQTRRLAVALLAAAALNSTTNAQQSPSVSPLAGGGATYIYVAEQPIGYSGSASILQFHADSSGIASPSNTLTLPSASSGTTFTVDSSGQIYAAISAYYEKSGASQHLARSAEIAVYASDALGSAAPLRTITEGVMNYPGAVAIDRSGNIYVADASGSIFVFSSTADGRSAPIRTIYGSLTHLSPEKSAGGLALDSNGYLYVSIGNSILVFSPDADKNVAPVRTITATYNGCKVSFGQLGFNDRNSLYAMTGNGIATTGLNPCMGVPTIFVFAAEADGDSTPLKTISPISTGKHSPFSFGVDRVGNIFTVNAGGNEISGFGPESDNATSPASQITVPNLPSRMISTLALQ